MESSNARWGYLPADLLLHIANIASSGTEEGLAAVKTRYRLVCKGWRQALPLGEWECVSLFRQAAKLGQRRVERGGVRWKPLANCQAWQPRLACQRPYLAPAPDPR